MHVAVTPSLPNSRFRLYSLKKLLSASVMLVIIAGCSSSTSGEDEERAGVGEGSGCQLESCEISVTSKGNEKLELKLESQEVKKGSANVRVSCFCCRLFGWHYSTITVFFPPYGLPILVFMMCYSQASCCCSSVVLASKILFVCFDQWWWSCTSIPES